MILAPGIKLGDGHSALGAVLGTGEFDWHGAIRAGTRRPKAYSRNSRFGSCDSTFQRCPQMDL